MTGRMTLPRVMVLGATVLGLLMSAQHFAVMQIRDVTPAWKTVRHALQMEMPWWYLWVVVAPVVVVVVRRWPLVRGKLATTLPVHLAVAAATVMIHSALDLVAGRLVGAPVPPGPLWDVYWNNILFRVTQGTLGYLVLFGTVVAADYYDRFRERERAAAALTAQLAEARLDALRMQLNPHFLFNTLNTIAMLVRREDHGQAVRMLAGLSEILRYVLEETPPQEVPLRQELEFAERYLAIEQSRFPDRLRVTVEAAPDTLEALVPNLVLQPLVENAIRHGIARRAAAGRLSITAARKGDRLELAVRDDGPGLEEGGHQVTPAAGVARQQAGIGLRNTASRLGQLYGERGLLELENAAGGGAVARVTIPFRLPVTSEELIVTGVAG